MKNPIKLLIAGVLGLSASQAAAHVALEDELYKATLDQGTLEAAEVFLTAYPSSTYAAEITALANDLIREQHQDLTFDRTGDPLSARSLRGEPLLLAKNNRHGKGYGHGRGDGHNRGRGHERGKGRGHGHHNHGGGY